MTVPGRPGTVPADMPEPADLILADADIWCGGAARRRARALAIRGDRVVAVGTDEQVRDLRGSHTEVVSLTGKTVVPGFQDSHVHAAFGARNLLNVNLDDLHSKDDYLARIKAVADANPDLDWIVGGGWYGPVFGVDQGPRKEDLDAIVPDRPVFLLNNDVHGAWVNSRALELAGITADSPDPWDGYAVRDADGSPTGCLQEGAAYDVCARWSLRRASISGRSSSAGLSESSTPWGSPGGRTPGWNRGCSMPTGRWTTRAASRHAW